MKILFTPNYTYKDENYRIGFQANRSKFDPEKLRKLVQYGSEGDSSVAQICKTLDITRAAYYYWVKKLDIQTPYRMAVKRDLSVTKEQILKLHSSGKTYQEIIKELGISQDAYNSLLARFGIVTEYKSAKQRIAEITKERMQALVKSGKSVKMICEELSIPERTYSRLLDKFGLITERKAMKRRVASISHEMLQRLVDAGCSKLEICDRLKINDSMFYRLLKRLHVQYNYLHNANEVKVSKQRLEELARSGKTVVEIAKELGVAVNTYHEKAREQGVSTVFRESIDRINSIPQEEIQKVLDLGMPVKEICEKFGISRMNYITLLRKHNLSTSQRESSARISEITKEQILAMRKAGKKRDEICKELNIGASTLRRILTAGKNLEQA